MVIVFSFFDSKLLKNPFLAVEVITTKWFCCQCNRAANKASSVNSLKVNCTPLVLKPICSAASAIPNKLTPSLP